MLETIAGGLVSAFHLRRRLMSLLEAVYAAQRCRARHEIIPVTRGLRAEFLAFRDFPCLFDIDLRAPAAPLLLSSDASYKEAGAACSISPELSVALCRHGLQKSLWAGLLSPVQAYRREQGLPYEGDELPEDSY